MRGHSFKELKNAELEDLLVSPTRRACLVQPAATPETQIARAAEPGHLRSLLCYLPQDERAAARRHPRYLIC